MASAGAGGGAPRWDRFNAVVIFLASVLTILSILLTQPILLYFSLTIVLIAGWFWVLPRLMQRSRTIASVISLLVILLALLGGIALGSIFRPFGSSISPTTVIGTAIALIPSTNSSTALPVEVTAITRVAATQIVVTEIAVTQVAITQIVATTPPIIVTITPLPPTSTPVNPPLAVGITYKNSGAELTLAGAEIDTNQMSLNWRFVNNTGQKLALKFSKDNFSAMDNLGNSIKVGTFISDGAYCDGFEKLLEPGEVIMNTNCGHPLQIYFDTSNCQIKEIIVTALNISSRIERAQWKIPVTTC